jgi:hypothetical protein
VVVVVFVSRDLMIALGVGVGPVEPLARVDARAALAALAAADGSFALADVAIVCLVALASLCSLATFLSVIDFITLAVAVGLGCPVVVADLRAVLGVIFRSGAEEADVADLIRP